MQEYKLYNPYFEKQRKFTSLVKDIQISLGAKEYKNQGFSLNEYVKMRWNISQAQAYRYLICAKVIDQLKEFNIQPCYERLCKSLYDAAKTPLQMKLLWSTILKKTNNNPEYVNSTHIAKIWKDICKDEKYAHICNQNDIISKIEKSLSKFENEKKQRQLNLNSKTTSKQTKTKTTSPKTTKRTPPPPLTPVSPVPSVPSSTEPVSFNYPSPSSSISSESLSCKPVEEPLITYNNVNVTVPQYIDCNSYSYNKPMMMNTPTCTAQYNNFETTAIPNMKTIYYLPVSNKVQPQYQYQNQGSYNSNFEPLQQTIIYYN